MIKVFYFLFFILISKLSFAAMIVEDDGEGHLTAGLGVFQFSGQENGEFDGIDKFINIGYLFFFDNDYALEASARFFAPLTDKRDLVCDIGSPYGNKECVRTTNIQTNISSIAAIIMYDLGFYSRTYIKVGIYSARTAFSQTIEYKINVNPSNPNSRPVPMSDDGYSMIAVTNLQLGGGIMINNQVKFEFVYYNGIGGNVVGLKSRNLKGKYSILEFSIGLIF
jgi:hypothetical protein